MRGNVAALDRVIKQGVDWLSWEQPDDAVARTSGIGVSVEPFYVTVVPVSDRGSGLIALSLVARDYESDGTLANPITDEEADVVSKIVASHATVASSNVIPGGGGMSVALDEYASDTLFAAISRFQKGCKVHGRYRPMFTPPVCTFPNEELQRLRRPEGWV